MTPIPKNDPPTCPQCGALVAVLRDRGPDHIREIHYCPVCQHTATYINTGFNVGRHAALQKTNPSGGSRKP